MAAMLMLPDPRREYAQTYDALPIARVKGYVLARVGFGPGTEFAGVTDQVTIDPSYITLVNLADEVSIGVTQRWQRLQAVYAAANTLPDSVSSLVRQHRDFLATGEPVTASLTNVVSQLVRLLDPNGQGDPLPWLERAVGIAESAEPTLPSPDQIGEEDRDLAIRAATQYRLTRARGASAARFSRATRDAYGHRCLFCGGKFGGIPQIRSGVDAAHILAWNTYDLDVVPNGLCLCKLHHWAFDAALVLPVYRDGELYLAFTELATELDDHSCGLLGIDGAPLDRAYLPETKALWPSKRYLDHLYADLAISFTP